MPILTQKEAEETFIEDEEDGDETRLDTSIALLQLDEQHPSMMDSSSIRSSTEESIHDPDTTNDHLKENITIMERDDGIHAEPFSSSIRSRSCILQRNNDDYDGTGKIIGPKQQLYEERYQSRIDDLLLRNKSKLQNITNLAAARDTTLGDGRQPQRNEDIKIGPYQYLYKERYEGYVTALLHGFKSKLRPHDENNTNDSSTIDNDCDSVPPPMALSPSSSQNSTSPPHDETMYNTQNLGQHHHLDSQTNQGRCQSSNKLTIPCFEQKSFLSQHDDNNTPIAIVDVNHTATMKPKRVAGKKNYNLEDNPPTTETTANAIANGRSQRRSVHELSRLNITAITTTTHTNKQHHLSQSKQKMSHFSPDIGEDSSLSSIELVRRSDGKREDYDVRGGGGGDGSSPSSPIMKSFRSPSYLNGKMKKRLASTSGKKGVDMRRMKHDEYYLSNEDNVAFSPYDEGEKEIIIDNYSYDSGANYGPLFDQGKTRRRSPSFLNRQLCSQSPISCRDSLLIQGNAALTHAPLDGTNSEEDMGGGLKVRGRERVMRKSTIPSIDSDNSLGHDPIFHPPQNSSFTDTNASQNTNNNDSIETADSMASNKKALQRNTSKENDPFNVSLREDHHFHLDPLQIYRPPRWVTAFHKRSKVNGKQNRKSRDDAKKAPYNKHSNEAQLQKIKNLCERKDVPTLTSYQEPFKDFGTRTSQRLEVVSEWLNKRDDLGIQQVNDETELGHDSNRSSSSRGKAVVLSVTLSQTISLGLFMMLQNVVRKIPYNSRVRDGNKAETLSNNETCKPPLGGGTLIIARSKEHIAEWECALRERTSFAVLNHSQMTSTERRHSKTAMKCVGFDVVLTTFDAVKAKEVATPVNEQGRAVSRNESQGGWLVARSCDGDTQPQPCEVLSILHGITWQRLLFVDMLGRQSYLTKPGTARCQAAITLKGSSRIIFFLQSSKENSFYEEKLKESRRQLVPLARALDLPENKTADTIVGKAMLDLNDVAEVNNQDRNGEIYHSQSSSSSEDYISESEVFS